MNFLELSKRAKTEMTPYEQGYADTLEKCALSTELIRNAVRKKILSRSTRAFRRLTPMEPGYSSGTPVHISQEFPRSWSRAIEPQNYAERLMREHTMRIPWLEH